MTSWSNVDISEILGSALPFFYFFFMCHKRGCGLTHFLNNQVYRNNFQHLNFLFYAAW